MILSLFSKTAKIRDHCWIRELPNFLNKSQLGFRLRKIIVFIIFWVFLHLELTYTTLNHRIYLKKYWKIGGLQLGFRPRITRKRFTFSNALLPADSPEQIVYLLVTQTVIKPTVPSNICMILGWLSADMILISLRILTRSALFSMADFLISFTATCNRRIFDLWSFK